MAFSRTTKLFPKEATGNPVVALGTAYVFGVGHEEWLAWELKREVGNDRWLHEQSIVSPEGVNVLKHFSLDDGGDTSLMLLAFPGILFAIWLALSIPGAFTRRIIGPRRTPEG